VELTGGRQIGLDLVAVAVAPVAHAERVRWPVRRFAVPEEELVAHAAFVAAMTDPLWRRVGAAAPAQMGS
jgi:DNA polymerase-3 subunit epsilon